MIQISRNKWKAAVAALLLIAALVAIPTTFAVNPSIPPGIEDPTDLSYGKQSSFGIAKYDDEFLDRIEWLKERTGVPLGVSYFTAYGKDPMFGTEPRLPVQVMFSDANGVTFSPEAYWIRYTPHSILTGLKAIYAGDPMAPLEYYPGYEVRHPIDGDPVGAAWPEMETRWGRKAGSLFHPSSLDSDKFKVGIEFHRPNGERFIKRRMVVTQSLFTATMGEVWEKF